MDQASVNERKGEGKHARSVARRSAHDFFDRTNREDPIAILMKQEKNRLQELLPLRHARMAVSPFAFYRGTAAVMAADLARTPRTGFTAQLCGDAHLMNFGLFGTPERNLTFDINDFDETMRGPWEWDVKRLVTSVDLAGRELGFSPPDRRDCMLACARAYRETMAHFAVLGNLEVWYARIDAEQMLEDYDKELAGAQHKRGRKEVQKALQRDNLTAFDKHTQTCVVSGIPHFIGNPPKLVPLHELESAHGDHIQGTVEEVLARYRASLEPSLQALLEQYTFIEIARNVVGVGSIGMRIWLAMFLGRDQKDPLLLQIKEATASVLEPYVDHTGHPQHGERVVVGQRLLQAHGDILLGWTSNVDEHGGQRHYYVRQLNDWKGSFALEGLSVKALNLRARICAWTLARGHARTGDRIAIAAYLGKGQVFDRATTRFASEYADQAERDHAALVRAINSGRVSTTDEAVN